MEGLGALRLDLHYLAKEHGAGCVTLTFTGTVVADDLAQLEAVDLKGEPWTSGRLTGLIDAPFLDVAPGTRQGIVPNEKAEAFARAMEGLSARVREGCRNEQDQGARFDRRVVS